MTDADRIKYDQACETHGLLITLRDDIEARIADRNAFGFVLMALEQLRDALAKGEAT